MSKSVLEKEYEIRIKVTCKVNPLDKAAASEDLKDYVNVDELYADPITWLMVERQQRLFALLLESRETLEQIMQHQALTAASIEIGKLLSKDPFSEDSSILELANKLKSSDDVQFFKAAAKNDVLWENIEHIDNRFTTEIGSVEVVPI